MGNNMKQRISIITLSVKDLKVSREFYGQLGWKETEASNENIAFFQPGGVMLALYPRAALAEDIGVPPKGEGFRGFTIAHNLDSKAEVDAALAEAVAAGATLVKAAQEVFWGGYSGYFADPDGHYWEVVCNPYFKFDEKGRPDFFSE